jgi:hypothetical protein
MITDHFLTEIAQLKGELSLAEEGLANYAQETAKLRYEVSRLNLRCQTMGWLLYPHGQSAREAVEGDI